MRNKLEVLGIAFAVAIAVTCVIIGIVAFFAILPSLLPSPWDVVADVSILLGALTWVVYTIIRPNERRG